MPVHSYYFVTGKREAGEEPAGHPSGLTCRGRRAYSGVYDSHSWAGGRTTMPKANGMVQKCLLSQGRLRDISDA
jgi:hypothetical protein